MISPGPVRERNMNGVAVWMDRVPDGRVDGERRIPFPANAWMMGRTNNVSYHWDVPCPIGQGL